VQAAAALARSSAARDGGGAPQPVHEATVQREDLQRQRPDRHIKLVPEQTVLRLEVGDRIVLDAEQFERLAEAYLAEIDAGFVQTGG
jgi:hypothetical protein